MKSFSHYSEMDWFFATGPGYSFEGRNDDKRQTNGLKGQYISARGDTSFAPGWKRENKIVRVKMSGNAHLTIRTKREKACSSGE